MKLAPLCILAGLLLLSAGRAVAADGCSDFSLEVGAAEHAYADYNAYLKSGSSEDVSVSFKVFSHLLDVAAEYSQECDIARHPATFKSYTRLEWYRDEYDYAQYTSGVSEGKRVIANSQSSELKLLWALGFGKSDPAEYSVMKSSTAAHFSELGMTFYSPETGKVLVRGNAAVANCEKNDHLPGFDGVMLAYPADAARAKLGGRFDINVLVDDQGKAESASAIMEGPTLDDPGQMSLVINVQQELSAEAEAATWTPGVVGCKPMAQDMLMLTATLDPVTGTVKLERWHDPNQ